MYVYSYYTFMCVCSWREWVSVYYLIFLLTFFYTCIHKKWNPNRRDNGLVVDHKKDEKKEESANKSVSFINSMEEEEEKYEERVSADEVEGNNYQSSQYNDAANNAPPPSDQINDAQSQVRRNTRPKLNQ